jgi:poly(hydroxyalkanoate) granule-associated protein
MDMAAKKRSRKAARSADSRAQQRMLSALHQVWLAGLGAVSKAQHGGPKVLEDLIEEGARFQSDTRGAAEEAFRALLGSVQSRFNAGVGQVRGQATDALDNLEKIFQARVHRALSQLGVPSSDEVEALSKRVDTLNRNIDKLAHRKPATRRGNGARRAAAAA